MTCWRRGWRHQSCDNRDERWREGK